MTFRPPRARILAGVLVVLTTPTGLVAAAPNAGRTGPTDESARLTRTLTIAPGAAVTIEASVGEIIINGWDRPEVTVEITRHAPSASALSKLTADIDHTPQRLRISSLQANGGLDPALRGLISVSAPVATVFESVRLVEGKITIANLRGAINADLRRGSIDASALAGRVRLETGIGNVNVRQAALTPSGLLRLRAFNGSVTLQFGAKPADARILALSFNGHISSDIPLTMKDRFGPRFGETTLGRGEPVVSIDVVNGNISIRAPSSR